MTWSELLQKIQTYKRDYEAGQVDLRAPSLITLLFAGALDEIVGEEKPSVSRYRELSDELLKALGSSAALPAAKKGDLIGIDSIRTDLDLHIWRSDVNPTYKFDFVGLFDSFLRAYQFERRQDAEVIYRRCVEGKPEVIVFKSLKPIFSDPKYKYLLARECRVIVGVVGVIKGYAVRKTKTGRDMGTFRLFMGSEFSETIYIWPDYDKTFLPYAKTRDIKNGRSGLAFVRPSLWNNSPQCTLVAWLPSNEKLSGQ